MNYERNIPLLYVYSVLIKRVVVPILTIYYLSFLLTYTQIGIIAAVTAIIALILEIPGGIFADVYGRRLSLMISSVFGILTMFFLYIGDNFAYFLTAGIMYGLSSCFISGTRDSLAYDTLVKVKKTHLYKKYQARVLFWGYFFNAFIMLLIPVVYSYNTKLPFLIGIFFFLAAVITAWLMIEPKVSKKKIKVEKRLFVSIKEIIHTPSVIPIILLMVIFGSFFLVSTEYIQPLLQLSDLEIIYFGVVYAIMRIIMGSAGEVAHRMEKSFKDTTVLFFSILLGVLAFLGYYLGNSFWVIIAATLLFSITRGFYRIVLKTKINHEITSDNRTTILSISQLCSSLFLAFLAFIVGVGADYFGVQEVFLYVTIAFALLSTVALAFYKNNVTESKRMFYKN